MQLKFQFHDHVPSAITFCSGGAEDESQFQFQFQIHVEGSERTLEFSPEISAVAGASADAAAVVSCVLSGITSAAGGTGVAGVLAASSLEG